MNKTVINEKTNDLLLQVISASLLNTTYLHLLLEKKSINDDKVRMEAFAEVLRRHIAIYEAIRDIKYPENEETLAKFLTSIF